MSSFEIGLLLGLGVALTALMLVLRLYWVKKQLHQHLQQTQVAANQAWLEKQHQTATELALSQAQVQQLQSQTQVLTQQAADNEQLRIRLEVELGQLQTRLAEKQQQFEQQQTQLKHEFESLARSIFNDTNQQFKEQSQQSLANLLSPFHQDVKAFKTQVEAIQKTETEQRLALKFELQNLQKLNLNLSDQAQQLTQALQGQKKAQGNWGEMILERVLESAGLTAPRDYQREVSIEGNQGRQRPDVVIYLPGNKHLIVDAKTSLAAYSRMVNAQDDAVRQAALKDHISALRDRMKELSDKDYFKLPGLLTPEVVILFVPIESAYVEAIKADGQLLDEAMRLNLLIATPSTLLSSVQIVRQLWRFAEHNNHSAELARRAELFYNKLNSFIGSLQSVGSQLDKAKEAYDKAFAQLYSGRGNLIKQASEFKDLGVLVQKDLPQDLVERAKLELVKDVAKLD
jgi:DNA recombination protein RmuC